MSTTELMTVEMQATKEIEMESPRLNAVLSQSKTLLVVQNDEQAAQATAYGASLNDWVKKMTKLFAWKKEDALRSCQKTDTEKRVALTPVEGEVSRLKSLLLSYNSEKERQRQIELAKQQKALERAIKHDKPLPAIVVPEAAPKTVQTAAGSSTLKENWIAVLVDKKGREIPEEMPLDAELYPEIPRSFLMVDSKKLNKHAKDHRDQLPVPGVLFKNRGSIAFR